MTGVPTYCNSNGAFDLFAVMTLLRYFYWKITEAWLGDGLGKGGVHDENSSGMVGARLGHDLGAGHSCDKVGVW